jgi:hypothetical protein
MASRALTPETAMQLKSDMYEGMKNVELIGKYSLGYQTLVNIKSGRQYGDIPWPDGQTGAMARMQNERNRNTRKFETRMNGGASRPEFSPQQSREEDEHLTKSLQSNEAWIRKTYPEYTDDITAASWRRFIKEYVRNEDIRKRTAEQDKRTTKHKEFMKTYKPDATPELKPGQLPNDQCDPDANEKMDWEQVKALAAELPVVQIADGEDDAPLKLAIQIVFLGFTSKQWGGDVCTRVIYQIKGKIEKFWELNP